VAWEGTGRKEGPPTPRRFAPAAPSPRAQAPAHKAPGRLVVLAGTGQRIRAEWDAAIAAMRPGDVLQLAPSDGPIVVPRQRSLAVPIAITLAGAPPPPAGAGEPAGHEGAGAPEGAAVIMCAEGADEALHLK
jgi:hypothetical protein